MSKKIPKNQKVKNLILDPLITLSQKKEVTWSLGFLNVKKGGTLPKLKIKGGRSFDGGISTKVI